MTPKPPASKSAAPSRQPRRGAEAAASSPVAEAGTFPIVGIGASAGGLEAFTQLLSHLPADPGLSFVLVQHLAPAHESMLPELLSRTTVLPVHEVKDGMALAPNRIYIMPPNTSMAVLHGKLSLIPRTEAHGHHLPVDFFLRSLADDQKSRAIGVILSGTASDGTEGLRAIKAAGGLTFAQQEASARYDGMPRSAIAAGVVDFILPPEGIARALVRIGRHPYLAATAAGQPEKLLPKDDTDLGKVFVLLRSATGVDFTYYKPTTVRRRIARRMALHNIEAMAHYVRLLRQSAAEQTALYEDLLINVTSFFRESEVFEALQKRVFPKLLKDRPGKLPIRVWVPGCSTGEEACSLAICLLESLQKARLNVPLEIFATDISEQAIEKARLGLYPLSISEDVAPGRLKRFFTKEEAGFRVIKSIREACIFARQDVTKDPPFSNLDLISCRNLLIYLARDVQRRVLATFHYALKPEGALVLGRSETVGASVDLFSLADKKNKIYRRKTSAQGLNFKLPDIGRRAAKATPAPGRGSPAAGFDFQREADRVLLSRFTPASVVVDGDFDIVQFRGHTGPFLEPAPGVASLNVLKMARDGLLPDLRAALDEAKQSGLAVRRTGVRIRTNAAFREITLDVIPIRPTPMGRPAYFLILFEEAAEAVAPAKESKSRKPARAGGTVRERQVEQYRRELDATKAYLQSVIDEQVRTNEDLQSASEEILSSNEELQSTNEELETAKEELQSANEELNTLNEELQTRNIELTQLGNDQVNLLNSVQIPIVMLDHELRIRRFTPLAERVLSLIASDIGRPVGDLRPNIPVPELEQFAHEVMATLVPRELEVQDRNGRWCELRLRPYKTLDHRIDGVVIALVDVDPLKRSLLAAQEERELAEALVTTAHEPILILDAGLRVQKANDAFYRVFQTRREETESHLLKTLGHGKWNVPRLQELLGKILPENTRLNGFELEVDLPGVGRKQLLLNAHRLMREGGKKPLIVLAMTENQKERST